MPEIIQFKNGNQIRNLYDASGQKLRSDYFTRVTQIPIPLTEGQIATDVSSLNNYLLTGTDYSGNIEYSFSNDQGDYQYDLDKIYNSEGYVSNLYVSTGSVYNYYRRDHLGNNREVWNANSNTTAQRIQYYPSGLPWSSSSSDYPDLQQKKYNGKEFVEMHGLDEYDSQARWFYPAIVRTTTLDPHCENYYDISPYAWCGNNPINRIDPLGLDTIDVNSQEDVKKDDIIVAENGQNFTASTDEVTLTAQKNEKVETKDNKENYNKEIDTLSSITLIALAEPTPLGEFIVLGYGSYLAWKHGPEIIGTAVDLTKEAIDKFAHTPKKQSTGKSGSDRHDAQYRHGGKNRPKNPNQRKDAEVRKNKGKTNN